MPLILKEEKRRESTIGVTRIGETDGRKKWEVRSIVLRFFWVDTIDRGKGFEVNGQFGKVRPKMESLRKFFESDSSVIGCTVFAHL